LDEVRLRQREALDGRFGPDRVSRAYAAAFRGHGIDAEAAGAEELATAVCASPARARLAAALDDWAAELPADEAALRGKLAAAAGVAQGPEELRDDAVPPGRVRGGRAGLPPRRRAAAGLRGGPLLPGQHAAAAGAAGGGGGAAAGGGPPGAGLRRGPPRAGA